MRQLSNHLAQWRAITQMFTIMQGKREPGAGTRIFSQQRSKRPDFRERRQRFAGQQIDTGIQQRLDARTVEYAKFIRRSGVVATVLRTIGQIAP
jgi:hypothetical protein